MTPECHDPLSSAEVFDYWAGDLEAGEEARVEEHVFRCASCAAALAEGEALATGLRTVVGSGNFHALVSDAVLNRLARDGVRVRTFALNPGDVVPCAVWDDDEVIVTRLRGHFPAAATVSVVATLATGEEVSRSDGITVRPGEHELVDAIAAAWLRQLPATTVRLRVTSHTAGQEEQLLGEYTLSHAGPLSH
jgi:anti-sigma factor RsiW